MELVLKVARHSAHHGDWVYYTGFDRVEKEDNWRLFLKVPSKEDPESGIGQGATFGLRCATPGHEQYEVHLDQYEPYVSKADYDDLIAGRKKHVPVVMIATFVRTEDRAWRGVDQLVCNTAALLLNERGRNVDRLV